MDNKNIRNKYLADILESISNIEKFIGSPKLFENYDGDIQLQSAVERQIEIIGEAVKRLLDMEPAISISFARRIVNTRNKISHGYDEVENSEIWNIIINYLPKLKAEAEKLIG
jgi:uncharacterized protein with HEPN domain